METGHSLLIVDDNPRNLQLLGNILTGDGYRVEFATNGRQALEWLEEQLFDLVLMDIMMPGMDGLEACRKIREEKKYSDMPVIFLTARTDKDSLVKGFEAGAQDYISKPFDKNELLSRVSTHVELHSSRRKLKEINRWLEEKVEERTAELEKANRELSNLDYAKTEFLNLIGHELRTPLNGIIGPMEIIKFDNPDDDMHRMIGLMAESVERLERFALDALLITKLRTGKHNFLRKKLLLDDILASVEEQLSSIITRSKTTIKRDYDTGIRLFVDNDLMVACISKMIENLLLHAGEPGELTIRAKRLKDATEIMLIDPRVDFTDSFLENMEVLFQPRGHYADANPGIGMALVKLVLDLHGGTLEIDNKAGSHPAIKIICKEAH